MEESRLEFLLKWMAEESQHDAKNRRKEKLALEVSEFAKMQRSVGAHALE